MTAYAQQSCAAQSAQSTFCDRSVPSNWWRAEVSADRPTALRRSPEGSEALDDLPLRRAGRWNLDGELLGEPPAMPSAQLQRLDADPIGGSC